MDGVKLVQVLDAHITHTYITESDILFTVLPSGNTNMENTGTEPKIEPFIPPQVLHAQGDNELTMVTQKAPLERREL